MFYFTIKDNRQSTVGSVISRQKFYFCMSQSHLKILKRGNVIEERLEVWVFIISYIGLVL